VCCSVGVLWIDCSVVVLCVYCSVGVLWMCCSVGVLWMYCSVDPFSVFMYMFGIDSGAAELQNTFRTTPVGK
jgi:hypothetical protein